MGIDPAELEQIVSEVVRRLTNDRSDVAPTDAKDRSLLVIEERVVTSAVLRGRLDGIESMQVRPDAIVTPLVRDLLKDESVQLIRSDARVESRTQPSYLLMEDKSTHGASMWNGLVDEPTKWQVVPTWTELLERLAKSDAQTAFVCTNRWADRLCGASQQGIPTVVVNDVASVEEALQQTPVRLVIVNPQRISKDEVTEIACRFHTLVNS